jgi:hypothetical protein
MTCQTAKYLKLNGITGVKSATQAHTFNIIFPGRQLKGDKLPVKYGSKLKCSRSLKETCQGMDLEERFAVRSRSIGLTRC